MSASDLDVLVIGAGAAGLMCAIEAGKRGRRVLVVDHASRPAEKIRISGGGRCNFTNLHTTPANYLSANPRFCISALSRYTPQNFIELVERHGIAYHEKARGELFCDGSSQQIIHLLLEECRDANVQIKLASTVTEMQKQGRFEAQLAGQTMSFESVVVASGGLSIPKMGATGFGYGIARQFGLHIIETRPALVPFTMSESQLAYWNALAGVALEATVQTGKTSFTGGLLFTHRGLSGPAVLQTSSYWTPGAFLTIDMMPGHNVAELLLHAKTSNPKFEAAATLSNMLPKRLAQRIAPEATRLGDMPNRKLQELAASVNNWQLVPNGTEGYRTAEVTAGGVDISALSSKTMECANVPGLYFIGEVVDVTGHLGGFNFQWAWASGFAAGQYA